MSTQSIDLVLVNPGGRRRIYQGLGDGLAAVEPPIWAGLMATFVRRHGFSCAILDANAEELDPQAVAGRVASLSPRLVAVVVYGHNPSASTQVMPAAGEICRALKADAPAQKIILVGGHVAALPERTLQEEAADFVAGGEAFHTLVDLLRALGETSSPDLSLVRDLWYREGEEVRVGHAAPLVQDLDRELPGIAWDLLPMERYRAHNWHCFGEQERSPYAALYTTLGCPYRCTFCCIQAPFKRGEQALGFRAGVNSYRFWSPEHVIREIDTLVGRYGIRNIKLADEMFVLNRRHVLGICELIRARGYDLNIWAYARVDSVRDSAMLTALRGAGFRWLAFGIEAGSGRVREAVAKGFDQEAIFLGLERVREAGIHIGANFIFGLPEDDAESMQATLDLAIHLNAEFANFYCAMAYPGSALYAQALQNGWPLPRSWAGYSQYAQDCLPLPTRHLTSADVLRFRDRAFQASIDSPRYRKLILERFGPDTLAEILSMASHSLRRELAPVVG